MLRAEDAMIRATDAHRRAEIQNRTKAIEFLNREIGKQSDDGKTEWRLYFPLKGYQGYDYDGDPSYISCEGKILDKEVVRRVLEDAGYEIVFNGATCSQGCDPLEVASRHVNCLHPGKDAFWYVVARASQQARREAEQQPLVRPQMIPPPPAPPAAASSSGGSSNAVIDLCSTEDTNHKKRRSESPPPPTPADICVVCQERVPNTMVLPCRHCVVCKQCSDKLAKDPAQARTCVYCRGRIQYVLD